MNRLVKDESGVALVGTVGLLLVMVTVGLAFLKMSAHESDSANQRYDQLKAFWKAEEGLSRGRAIMNRVKEPDNTRAATLDNGEEAFTARIEIHKMKESEFDAYSVSAEVFPRKDPDQAVFSLMSVEKPKVGSDFFMYFQYAGDYPDACPYFDTGDTINGHLASGTYIPITGHPVFRGPVTTGDPFPGYKPLPFHSYTPPENIQNTGEVFPVPTVAEKLREKGTPIALHTEQRAVILLTGSGYELRSRDLHNENAGTTFLGSHTLPEGKGAGIFVQGDVEVSGVLSGKLTIGASGDIIITDNLVYADADRSTGRPAPGSTHVLGLIAEGNVFVKQKQVAPFIGRGIIIDASILAMHSTFSVLNYRDYPRSMGVMRLWGNVVQYERGIIGNVKLRGTVEMGYYKDWHYDERLPIVPPPYMPPLRDTKGFMRFKTIYWKRPDV